MKKSTKKGIAVAALILAALYGFHKFGMPMMKKPATADNSKPKEFTTKPDREGNFTKFWFDGKKYWKQKGGPMVKSQPLEIMENEYSQEYSN